MLVAAYLVGGFMVASVYAVGMLQGPARPLPPARVPHPVHASRPSPARSRWSSATPLARWVYNNEPTKFAAIELVPETASDVPETLLGRLNADGDVSGGIPIPGLASILSDPLDGTSTVIQGLDSFPADERPTTSPGQHRAPRVGRDGRHRHDVVPAVGLVRVHVVAAAATSRSRSWFLRAAAVAGVAAVVAMEAGWVVTEVGRQPWIVLGPHEGRGRGDDAHRRVDHVHRDRGALRRRRVTTVAGPARDEPAVPRRATSGDARRAVRAAPPSTPSRAEPRDERTSSRSCCSSASRPTRCSAAPTSAPGSGISSRAAPGGASGRAR